MILGTFFKKLAWFSKISLTVSAYWYVIDKRCNCDEMDARITTSPQVDVKLWDVLLSFYFDDLFVKPFCVIK